MLLKDANGEKITLLHNDIIKLIPHRHPFLFIDKLTDIIINKSITGIKAVTFNESFFPGHFPEHPVMPGVLILEAMAQTAACLVSYDNKSLSLNNLVFFTDIEKAILYLRRFLGNIIFIAFLALIVFFILYLTIEQATVGAYATNNLIKFYSALTSFAVTHPYMLVSNPYPKRWCESRESGARQKLTS